MKKKVLICGSTGFIGRNIAEKLCCREDLEVYGTHFNRPALRNSGIRPIYADLTNPQHVDEAVRGKDFVIQAAATTSGANDIVNIPHVHVTNNAVMNSLVFRAAHEHSVSRLIFFSCAIMYQSSPTPLKETDFNENEEIHPLYFGAAWTKVYAEKMCEFYSRLGRTKHTVIRHSNIYGPYDKYDLEHSHVFGATIAKVMNRDNDKVVVWGPGTEKRDFLYVGDLVDFVEKAVVKQESAFELINVGYGCAVSVKELVAKVVAASERKLKIEHDPLRPHIPTKVCLDCSRAEQVFDWAPSTSLEEGIFRTIDWYEKHRMQTQEKVK